MKPKVKGFLKEVLIALSLAAVATPLSFAAVAATARVTGNPLVLLSVLVLSYALVTCGIMRLRGVRARWKLALRSVASAVLAAALVFAAVKTMYAHVVVLSHMASGEGGFVHKVGEASMRSSDGARFYSVYWGNVKYGAGGDMRALILISKGSRGWTPRLVRSNLLVGESGVCLPNGLEFAWLAPGKAAVSCLGCIDITADKVGANATVSVSDADGVRAYSCTWDEWDDATQSVQRQRTYRLEIPLSCFAELERARERAEPSADAAGGR